MVSYTIIQKKKNNKKLVVSKDMLKTCIHVFKNYEGASACLNTEGGNLNG